LRRQRVARFALLEPSWEGALSAPEQDAAFAIAGAAPTAVRASRDEQTN
jgi:hypothetical protein